MPFYFLPLVNCCNPSIVFSKSVISFHTFLSDSDRDLLAMRTYFDCGLIDVGVIVTRSEELNDIFRKEKDNMGNSLIRKYGASTTWTVFLSSHKGIKHHRIF